jgi:hypothetical protein
VETSDTFIFHTVSKKIRIDQNNSIHGYVYVLDGIATTNGLMERLGLVVHGLAHVTIIRPFYMQSREGTETASGFTLYML